MSAYSGAAVGLDVTPLGAEQTGIGRYTYELLGALWRLGPDGAVVAVGNRGAAHVRLPDLSGADRGVLGPRLPSRAAWTFGALPWWLPRAGLGVFHGTSYYAPIIGPVPTVVTFHDMSVLACPDRHPRARVVRAQALLGRVARHASAIITPSAFSATEIVRWLGVPAERIHVVPGAAAGTFSRPLDTATIGAVAARFGLQPGFLLCLGTVEPRKNIGRVLQAAARLRRGGAPVRVVIAGRLGWGFRPILDQARALGLEGAVRFVGFVSDADLRGLMALASALVYPSLYEGFGLPVVEAMAAGLPVVTSRTGALAEVAGGAALLVDPYDTDAIADALQRASQDGDLRAVLRRRGLARAGEFSWERSARETLAVYATVIGSSGR